jgi:hypothetical protein
LLFIIHALKTFYTAINEDIAVINYQLEEKTQQIIANIFFIEPTGEELLFLPRQNLTTR